MRKYLDLDSRPDRHRHRRSSGIGRANCGGSGRSRRKSGSGRQRDAARLAETQASVRERGVDAESVNIELTADEPRKSIVEAANRRFSGFKILINCAGIFEPHPSPPSPSRALIARWPSTSEHVRIDQAALSSVFARRRRDQYLVDRGLLGIPAVRGLLRQQRRDRADDPRPGRRAEWDRKAFASTASPGNIRTPMNRDQFASPRNMSARSRTRRAWPDRRRSKTSTRRLFYLASPAAKFVQWRLLARGRRLERFVRSNATERSGVRNRARRGTGCPTERCSG